MFPLLFILLRRLLLTFPLLFILFLRLLLIFPLLLLLKVGGRILLSLKLEICGIEVCTWFLLDSIDNFLWLMTEASLLFTSMLFLFILILLTLLFILILLTLLFILLLFTI